MSETLFADRYRLERRLGIGGMATVQLAIDTRLERHVAVKLLAEHLAEDASFVSRFRREALAAARLVHPNIVQVFDFGVEEAARPPVHRHGVRRRAVVRRDPARARAARRRRDAVDDPRPGLPRARLRAPQRRRAPRRQAGQPAARPRRRGQAGRLRHRQGGRAVGHHARSARCSAPPPTCRRSRRAASRPGRRPTSTRSASSPTSCCRPAALRGAALPR